MFTVEEKNYLTIRIEANKENLDYLFGGDIKITVRVLRVVNGETRLKDEIRNVLNLIGPQFNPPERGGSFILFYFSDDVDPESKADYEVKNDIVDMDTKKCAEKVLKIMGKDSFVRWSKSSQELNKFLSFS